MTTVDCTSTCDTHDWICMHHDGEGHNGRHECDADQSWKDRQYERALAARIAARKQAAEIADLITTTPDVD